MRNNEQITSIKKEISDPFSCKNMLSENDVQHLISLFEDAGIHENKIYKNTGPVTLDLSFYFDDSVIKKILNELKKIIGDYEITSSFFFCTDYPHIIHNDDTYDLPSTVYKAITLPLKLYSDIKTPYPKLCFFNQFYYHGPAKFFRDDNDIATYYNRQIYDYSNVDGISESEIDSELYELYFTHLKRKWLKGLSLYNTLDWIPGDALIFDSVRLHCASDFRKLGIKSKLGISIFTKKI
jgi:hypothetical protein